VVFMSGCSGSFAESLDGYDCLQKPFKPQELASAVAKRLTAK